jgi:hypothetical protein
MPIITLGAGDQLTVGADAAGGKVVSLLVASAPAGIYVPTQSENLFDVALEATHLMEAAGVVIKATVTLPSALLDISVEKTKQ